MKYQLSFVAGALLHNEAKLYIHAINDISSYLKNEEDVSMDVLTTNAESSRKRIKAELDKRLLTLDKDYLEQFKQANETDQKIILFLSICKAYQIITEFAIEVVYQKWKMFDNSLETYDFDYFLTNKLSDEQLENITDKTKYKLAQVGVKIFKDVGIFANGKIQALRPSEELNKLIKAKQDQWFLNCILL